MMNGKVVCYLLAEGQENAPASLLKYTFTGKVSPVWKYLALYSRFADQRLNHLSECGCLHGVNYMGFALDDCVRLAAGQQPVR